MAVCAEILLVIVELKGGNWHGRQDGSALDRDCLPLDRSWSRPLDHPFDGGSPPELIGLSLCYVAVTRQSKLVAMIDSSQSMRIVRHRLTLLTLVCHDLP
ncbi:hypothetical protein WB44_05215 [Synechococcus sp. WH 8020]|nr:hypothetical protein WB44_05215 [Synechococcus sp. WH 8020]